MTQHEPTAAPAPLDAIQQALLAWFAANGRDLPWRKIRDPYQILVSEVMLQQTQVDRVIPKWQAFLAQFPTLQALADAPTADVITAWAGLGYNRRAVNLQRTARAVLEAHGGSFPQDVATLRSLPGIGPYTSGAVACFAFEQDVAFIDTNIRRVIQRVFFGSTPTPEPHLLVQAAAIVPAGQGWAWNQSIMELGALICTAANPACWRCPLQSHCRDLAERRVQDADIFAASTPAPRPRRIAEKKEAPFAGSSRFYRGRIIDALRAAPGNRLALDVLARQIKPDFGPGDQTWLDTLVRGLVRDHLLVLEAESVRLP